jgi:hypothetical protein
MPAPRHRVYEICNAAARSYRSMASLSRLGSGALKPCSMAAYSVLRSATSLPRYAGQRQTLAAGGQHKICAKLSALRRPSIVTGGTSAVRGATMSPPRSHDGYYIKHFQYLHAATAPRQCRDVNGFREAACRTLTLPVLAPGPLDDLAYLPVQLENGRRDPHLSTIAAVAKGLRVAPSELLVSEALDTSRTIGAVFERAPPEAQAAVMTLLRLVVSPTPKRASKRKRT